MCADSGSGGGTSGGSGQPRRDGFTLTELVIVVGLIAVLAAVLLPYLDGTFAVARRTACQGNLRRIAQALHAGEKTASGGFDIPTGYGWVGAAAARGSKEILFCMDDDRDRPANHDLALRNALAELYVLQYHYGTTNVFDCSFIPDILDPGVKVQDPQIWAIYPAGGVHDKPKGEFWPADLLVEPSRDQAFIGVDNDSCILITFGSRITIECREAPQMASRHWVMKGQGTPLCPCPFGTSPGDEDDHELLRMWSADFGKMDPRSPYVVSAGAETSYGINGLLTSTRWGPGQIMLMDANEVVVDVGTPNREDALEDVVRPRHMGKANVCSVDGSVAPMTVLELEREFEDPRGRWGSR